MKKIALVILLLVGTSGALLAAEPPALINYQGVLRDALDNPLNGDHDMVFHFWTADEGGDEILIDAHTVLNGNPVTISGGLFNVALGGGVVSDGSGPGGYSSLAEVFRDYAQVFLAIEVGEEMLSPRIRVVAAGYALNASHLDGVDSTQLIRSDTSDSFTSGTLTIGAGTALDVDGTLQIDGAVTKSTTDLVANFNADLLDGNDSSSFAAATHDHVGSDITGPVAEATNADTVDGKHASDLIDTSSAAQVKSGPLTVDAGSTITSTGVTGLGTDGGGYFADSDSSGHAYVGNGDHGIRAFGSTRGGYFGDVDGSGTAEVASGDYGIRAFGNEMGGYFEDADGSGYARVGFNNWGVRGFGNGGGGYFQDLDGSGYANVGYGNRGIEAFGNVLGGKFEDIDSSGVAHVAYGDRGIEAFGSEMGGYFADADDNGYAYVGYATYGIRGYGVTAGGYFEDSDDGSFGYVGTGVYGVWAGGNSMGGFFEDRDHSGYAYLGVGDMGVKGYGNGAGGYFEDLNSSGRAYLAYGDRGIEAHGDSYGGYFSGDGPASIGIRGDGWDFGGWFHDWDSGSFTRTAYDTYKVWGVGTLDFVQNHPHDRDLAITYAAPEGDEVATYTRGTARLVNGEARVRLGETFEWVTNPDIGLTAWVTPIGDWSDLYVAERSTTELVVRSRAGAPDVEFDFIVFGLRIGFEEVTVLQEKEVEAFIPSMNSHHERYARRPDLRRYNALERYKRMYVDVTGSDAESLDVSASRALRDAIHEYDPATDPPVNELFGHDRGLEARQAGSPRRVARAASTGPRLGSDLSADDRIEAGLYSATVPDDTRDETLAEDVFPVSEAVEPGDLLALDPDEPGKLRRADTIADPGVVGIVVGDYEDVDGDLQAPVALFGLAVVKADASYGAVLAGDLLTTSPTPGHAMAAIVPTPGTVIGKALEPLETGTGTIRVVVMLR